jgi:hypothetical protein
MKNRLLEIFGWYGTIAIVGAYFLVSTGFIASNSLIYQALNASGSLGIVFVSYKKRAFQPAVLNVIWLLIALYAIAMIFIKK